MNETTPQATTASPEKATRRATLLGTITATLAGGGLVKAAHSPATIEMPTGDAVILRHFAEFRRLSEEVDQLHLLVEELPDYDPQRPGAWATIHAAVAELHEHQAAIAQLPATTTEALRAKAWIVRRYNDAAADLVFDPYNEDAVTHSLAGDLLAMLGEARS